MVELKTLKELKSDNQKVTQAARGFINSLLDDKSFVEMDAFVKGESFESSHAGEGVVSGTGRILDNNVMIFCQNPEVMKGALGFLHTKKIEKCIEQAVMNDIPLISIIDTHGVRLNEGIAALNGFAGVLKKADRLTAPHIAVVKGSSLGLMSYYTQYADIVIMMEKAVMASTSPLIISAKSGKEYNAENFNAAANLKNGICDIVVKTESELKSVIHQLLALFSGSGNASSNDDPNRVSDKINRNSDVRTLINEILDKKSFIEMMKANSEEVVAGFGQIDGISVGIIANNPAINGGRLTEQSYLKINRITNLCEQFEIPVINLVNSQGIAADLAQEKDGLIGSVFSVIRSYLDVSRKISVITGSAIGASYVALASKDLGYDYVLGWESADISVLDDVQSAELFYADEIASATDKEKVRNTLRAQYKQDVSGIVYAAQQGLIDNIIEPGATRPYLAALLQNLVR